MLAQDGPHRLEIWTTMDEMPTGQKFFSSFFSREKGLFGEKMREKLVKQL